jgi:hypothetical protein
VCSCVLERKYMSFNVQQRSNPKIECEKNCSQLHPVRSVGYGERPSNGNDQAACRLLVCTSSESGALQSTPYRWIFSSRVRLASADGLVGCGVRHCGRGLAGGDCWTEG